MSLPPNRRPRSVVPCSGVRDHCTTAPDTVFCVLNLFPQTSQTLSIYTPFRIHLHHAAQARAGIQHRALRARSRRFGRDFKATGTDSMGRTVHSISDCTDAGGICQGYQAYVRATTEETADYGSRTQGRIGEHKAWKDHTEVGLQDSDPRRTRYSHRAESPFKGHPRNLTGHSHGRRKTDLSFE